jgi:plastocyanin
MKGEQMHRAIRFLMPVMAAAAILGACASSPEENHSSSPDAGEIWMQNVSFVPEELTVPAGTTVSWTNRDNVRHVVKSGRFGSPTDQFESGDIEPGGTFSVLFETPGTYSYFCTLHPIQMTGAVIVTDGGSDGTGPLSQVVITF